MTAVIETSGLGKQYGRRWALRDCTLAIPEGKVVGLVGPNGAGQDHAAAPGRRAARSDGGHDQGARRAPGRRPGPARAGRLRRPGHAHLRRAVGRQAPPHGRLPQPELGRRAGRRAGSSSSASTRASGPGRCPAASGPSSPSRWPSPSGPSSSSSTSRWPAWTRWPDASSSRVLMEVVAEHGVSVVLSSHLVADLERVCDYLVVLVASHVQVAGEVERAAGDPPPPLRSSPRPGQPSGGPGGHRGEPHRQAEHAPRAHRRADPRPGLDRQAGDLGGSRARLHEPGARRRAASPSPDWGSFDDPVRLAAVPHPGRSWPSADSRSSPSSWRSPARTSSTSTTRPSPPARPTATVRRRPSAFLQQRPHACRSCSTSLSSSCPALIGIFWGAPLVARELETGTFRLAWTQSVTRTRWLAVKLGVVGLASMAVAGLLSLMVTWWSSPIDRVNASIVRLVRSARHRPVGYAAFAFVLGVTAGVLIRRTLPAMATTLAAFVATRLLFNHFVLPKLIAADPTVLCTQSAIRPGLRPNERRAFHALSRQPEHPECVVHLGPVRR